MLREESNIARIGYTKLLVCWEKKDSTHFLNTSRSGLVTVLGASFHLILQPLWEGGIIISILKVLKVNHVRLSGKA